MLNEKNDKEEADRFYEIEKREIVDLLNFEWSLEFLCHYKKYLFNLKPEELSKKKLVKDFQRFKSYYDYKLNFENNCRFTILDFRQARGLFNDKKSMFSSFLLDKIERFSSNCKDTVDNICMIDNFKLALDDIENGRLDSSRLSLLIRRHKFVKCVNKKFYSPELNAKGSYQLYEFDRAGLEKYSLRKGSNLDSIKSAYLGGISQNPEDRDPRITGTIKDILKKNEKYVSRKQKTNSST